MMERREREGYSEASLSSNDLSPYSTSSTYSGESHGFYHDYDWQGREHALYTLAEKPDISQVHIYPAYATHPDMYPGAALWHHSHDEGVAAQMGMPGLTTGVTLAPARVASASSSNSSVTGKPKRKRVQSAPQRKAANIRERKRMFHLNEAFDSLRKRLPAFNYEKRLSRIETLRLAITYISFMKSVMDGEDPRQVKLRQHREEDGLHLNALADVHLEDGDSKSCDSS